MSLVDDEPESEIAAPAATDIDLTVPSCSQSSQTHSSQTSHSSQPPQKKVKLETDVWFEEVMVMEAMDDPNESIACRNEVNRYFSDPLGDHGTLDWWKGRAEAYPRLAALAKKYLSCPASSVPSERIFSLAGNIVSKKRASLKPENVDMLIFLKKNT